MNKSYTILAVKGLSTSELSSLLKLERCSTKTSLGEVVFGDEAIGSIFGLGSRKEVSIALVPTLKEESEMFYSLLGDGRSVGLFESDFETASASVSIFEGFDSKSKWKVVAGELQEDNCGRFGEVEAHSEDALFFEDLDVEPWNDLYGFVGESPDDTILLVDVRQ